MEQTGGGFSAFVDDRVIAAAGIVQFWGGRAQVWALMTPQMRERALIIHRAVSRYMRAYACDRLECVIDPTFLASVTWAKRLGFTYESTMPKYGIDGRTMEMWVRL